MARRDMTVAKRRKKSATSCPQVAGPFSGGGASGGSASGGGASGVRIGRRASVRRPAPAHRTPAALDG
jgi:hypothetical protein